MKEDLGLYFRVSNSGKVLEQYILTPIKALELSEALKASTLERLIHIWWNHGIEEL